MKLDIDKEILNKTAKCKKEFSCIHKDDISICKIDFFLTDGILILKCVDNITCSYQKPFDNEIYVCTCPTRNGIYKKYNL